MTEIVIGVELVVRAMVDFEIAAAQLEGDGTIVVVAIGSLVVVVAIGLLVVAAAVA